MAQNITIMGASYSAVPAVTLPKTGGGTARFDDASVTTATAEDVASGKVFLAADGTITSGTATGGGTLITKSITANGTYDAEDDNADGYSSVTVNVSGGGDSSYTLLNSSEVSGTTTSNTAKTLGTIAIGDSLYTANAIIYVKIRDKAGKRNGFFYGTDTFFVNAYAGKGSSQSLISIRPTILYSFDANGKTKFNPTSGGYVFTNNSGSYGVYAATITNARGITIQARYNSNAGTINGTYKVDIYLLKWPDNSSPISPI